MAGPNLDRIGIPALIIGGVVWAFLSWEGDKSNQSGAARRSVQSDVSQASPPANAASKPSLTLPGQEQRFVDIVVDARKAYKRGANDMAKGAARPMRGENICAFLSDMRVSGWVGRVKSLSSNGDGKGVLSVDIGEGITIETSNNSFSDSGYNTLIEPRSKLFRDASALSKGQVVRFSGTFIRGDVDCVRETSLSLAGSLEEPDFMFKFATISAY